MTQSNSLVLGSIKGVNGATADTNVGIGLTAPVYRLHVVDPGAAGLRVQTNSGGGAVASFGGNGDFQIDSNGIVGGRFIVKENGNVGIGTTKPTVALEVKPDPNINFFDPKALAVHGNAVQDASYFGFVKALIFVRQDGVILRCYNSQVTGSASRLPPCGFQIINVGGGGYSVVLGSPFNKQPFPDIFWSVTAGINSDGNLLSAQAFEDPSSLGVIRVVITNPSCGLP